MLRLTPLWSSAFLLGQFVIKSISWVKNLKRRQAVKIRPLQDRVILKRIEEEEKSKGGIIIPDTAKETPQEGKVVAVGKGKVNEDGNVTPLDVKVNDIVLFGKYAGSEINIDGEEHLIMREEDILGIIEK
jgi:chaperonin GroES